MRGVTARTRCFHAHHPPLHRHSDVALRSRVYPRASHPYATRALAVAALPRTPPRAGTTSCSSRCLGSSCLSSASTAAASRRAAVPRGTSELGAQPTSSTTSRRRSWVASRRTTRPERCLASAAVSRGAPRPLADERRAYDWRARPSVFTSDRETKAFTLVVPHPFL